VAHGLHPPLGLFHDNEQNAFNLADDLIEPFRPLVDLYAAKNIAEDKEDLQPIDKQELVALLNVDIGMATGAMSVLSAVEYAVESLVRVYETGQVELDLPRLLGLAAHKLEY
jgi:CRISPR-associated protein Cas1